MKVIKTREVPTGHIVISEGEKGLLEYLSIADYGKEKNIKADFLGLTKDIEGVPHGDLMPLTDKWVITISTQYGCSMGCNFCDVPKVGHGKNATYKDMLNQIRGGLALHPEISGTKRLNIHFARMGEPTFNGNVLDVAMCLRRNIFDFWMNSKTIHPVVSTMMPKNNKYLHRFLYTWCHDVKNNLYQGEAGLQISINSTNDKQRDEMFSGNSLSLDEIAHEMAFMPPPKGRKYTLNFALADGYEINPGRLESFFDPKHFMVKITPIHYTKSCKDNKIQTSSGYDLYEPYRKIEEGLQAYGFDVIVFIPSIEEDESKITCGNAILSETD